MTDLSIIYRAEWQDPKEPIAGPPLIPSKVTRIVNHYTAAENLIDGDIGEDWTKLPAYLRQMQHAYLTDPKRGYSLGYNWGFDQRGGIWQIRGWDIHNAANKGRNAPKINMNDTSISFLLLVDGDDEASSAMVTSVQHMFKEAETLTGNVLIIDGHRDVDATHCPGDGVYGQILIGAFYPLDTPTPTPPVIPPTGKKEVMIIVDYGIPTIDKWWTRMYIAGGNIGWVQGLASEWDEPDNPTTPENEARHARLIDLATGHMQVQSDQHMIDLLATFHAVTNVPSTFVGNQRLITAWTDSQTRT